MYGERVGYNGFSSPINQVRKPPSSHSCASSDARPADRQKSSSFLNSSLDPTAQRAYLIAFKVLMNPLSTNNWSKVLGPSLHIKITFLFFF